MIATVAETFQGGTFAVGQECATGKEETRDGKPFGFHSQNHCFFLKYRYVASASGSKDKSMFRLFNVPFVVNTSERIMRQVMQCSNVLFISSLRFRAYYL
jgi:hypothetical protein